MTSNGPSYASEGSSLSPSSQFDSPTTYFYPYATSPDIIRSHEKDAFVTATLMNQVQSIIRSLRGARFAHVHAETIKHLTEILYFSLTTLVGNRTLGEEYCDVIQLEDDTLQRPDVVRRAGYILCSILVPWMMGRVLPPLRQKMRSKLERSLQRQQVREVMRKETENPISRQSSKRSLITKTHIQQYVLEHLDSLTSPSPIYAFSLTVFYFSGSYYHLSKRLCGLRYVFTKKIGESEERVGYEVLGVLLVLQMTVQSILHVRETFSSLHRDQEHKLLVSSDSNQTPIDYENIQDSNDLLPASIQYPSSIPRLSVSNPRYNLLADPLAIPWIPQGQQRKCTLCLEPFKDPSVTTCGHVFCWACVRDWVREKPECPLCRQSVQASKILPLRG